ISEDSNLPRMELAFVSGRRINDANPLGKADRVEHRCCNYRAETSSSVGLPIRLIRRVLKGHPRRSARLEGSGQQLMSLSFGSTGLSHLSDSHWLAPCQDLCTS